MEKDRFGVVLTVYLALLTLIAGFAVFMVHAGTFPPPTMIQAASEKDELFQEMLEDTRQKREQNGALTKLATHGFDVVSGAPLGFLASNGIRLRTGAVAVSENGRSDDTSNT